MAGISARTIQAVRERAQILDVFEGVQLRRMGREFVTRCPWHDDTRPSLSINPAKGFAYCHVCAHGVDSLGWLQDRGATFAEAVEQLASRYNVPVELENPADNERMQAEREQRAALLRQRERDLATFGAALWANRAACLYLKGRGVTRATAEAWGLGFAQGRLMIPLRDHQGRVVAFTGRALGDQLPKYKNSPNDLIFQKARMIFGLDRAVGAIRQTGEVVVVEGQFDVIKLHQEGIENVVALSGTALTAEQIEGLTRRTGARVLTLCFDGDRAGEKAARSALEQLQGLAISEAITLRILSLPAGEDPDSICQQQGAAAVRQLLEGAPSWVEWWLDRELARVDLTSAESVALAERGVARILRALPLGPRRSFVQRRAADVLGSAPSVCPAAPVETVITRDRRKWAERRALRLYLLHQPAREALQGALMRVPPYVVGWGLARGIEALLGDRSAAGLATAWGRAIQALPEDDLQELRSLVNPIPEVLLAIRSNPEAELAAALEALDATDLGTLQEPNVPECDTSSMACSRPC